MSEQQKMTLPLVFIHGWSFNSTFWHPLIDELPGLNCHTIDLGFVAGGVSDWPDVNKKAIYVGHSLGLLWLLAKWQAKGNAPDGASLISIAGFSDFMAFTPKAGLEKTREGLAVNPRAQLLHFWGRTGARGWLKNPVTNLQNLMTGLDWLETWNLNNFKEELDCPVHVIAARQDNIVPETATIAEWENQVRNRPIIWHEDAPHAIPLSHPKWLADAIRTTLQNPAR